MRFAEKVPCIECTTAVPPGDEAEEIVAAHHWERVRQNSRILKNLGTVPPVSVSLRLGVPPKCWTHRWSSRSDSEAAEAAVTSKLNYRKLIVGARAAEH